MSNKSLAKTFIELLLAFSGFFCAQNAAFAQNPKIMLIESAVTSASSLTYTGLISGIEESAKPLVIETKMFKPDGDRESAFWQGIIKEAPDIIVTIGTPAAKSAFAHIQQVPIIYTMTLDGFEKLQPEPSSIKHTRFGGVSISIPLHEQLIVLTNALPTIRRVGILYTVALEKSYQDAILQAKATKTNVVGARVESYTDIPNALKGLLPNIDALIAPPDVNIYHPDAIQYILNTCFDKGIPVLAFSEQLAIAGAPLAVSPNYEDLGRQTAELVLRILSGETDKEVLNQTPRSIELFINHGTATGLGLYFSREILNSATMVGQKNRE